MLGENNTDNNVNDVNEFIMQVFGGFISSNNYNSVNTTNNLINHIVDSYNKDMEYWKKFSNVAISEDFNKN